MEPFRDDKDLAAELRALRPEPRPEFTAKLDERAAAGFPRRSAHSGGTLAGLFSRLRAVPPRRLALSAGTTALVAIAIATVVVAGNEPDTHSASFARLSPQDNPTSIPEAQPRESGSAGCCCSARYNRSPPIPAVRASLSSSAV